MKGNQEKRRQQHAENPIQTFGSVEYFTLFKQIFTFSKLFPISEQWNPIPTLWAAMCAGCLLVQVDSNNCTQECGKKKKSD